MKCKPSVCAHNAYKITVHDKAVTEAAASFGRATNNGSKKMCALVRRIDQGILNFTHSIYE